MKKIIDVICFTGGGLMILFHFTKTRVFDFINWQAEGSYGNYTKGLDDFICPALLPIGVILIISGLLYNKWNAEEHQGTVKSNFSFLAIIILFIINVICIQLLSNKIDNINSELNSMKQEVSVPKHNFNRY